MYWVSQGSPLRCHFSLLMLTDVQSVSCHYTDVMSASLSVAVCSVHHWSEWHTRCTHQGAALVTVVALVVQETALPPHLLLLLSHRSAHVYRRSENISHLAREPPLSPADMKGRRTVGVYTDLKKQTNERSRLPSSKVLAL